MQIWLWFSLPLLIIPLLLVFSVKPEAALWVKIARLVGAIAAFYFIINAAAHYEYQIIGDAYNECQNLMPEGYRRMYPECGDPPNGSALAFIAVLGWVPAVGYAGFCELGWRVYYRRVIGKMWAPRYENYFSNVLIVFALIISIASAISLSSLMKFAFYSQWYLLSFIS